MSDISPLDEMATAIKGISKLITKVEFCPCFNDDAPCENPTVYIHHVGSVNGIYHCTHISNKGLMVNSNGHHPIEVHDAMNEAIKIAKIFLEIK